MTNSTSQSSFEEFIKAKGAEVEPEPPSEYELKQEPAAELDKTKTVPLEEFLEFYQAVLNDLFSSDLPPDAVAKLPDIKKHARMLLTLTQFEKSSYYLQSIGAALGDDRRLFMASLGILLALGAWFAFRAMQLRKALSPEERAKAQAEYEKKLKQAEDEIRKRMAESEQPTQEGG